MRDGSGGLVINKRTYLEPMWFSMRYQVAEKFSLVKSPLIPGNVSSMSFCGSFPLKRPVNKDERGRKARTSTSVIKRLQEKVCSIITQKQRG